MISRLEEELARQYTSFQEKAEKTHQYIQKLEELLDTRAGRLLRRGQFFVVVADDEPYFEDTYDIIRAHALEREKWTVEDETMYQYELERSREVKKKRLRGEYSIKYVVPPVRF